MDRHFAGRAFVCLLFLVILLAGAAAAEEARNVAAGCAYTWIGGSDKNAEALFDGRRDKSWQSLKSRDTWLEVALNMHTTPNSDMTSTMISRGQSKYFIRLLSKRLSRMYFINALILESM